MPTATATNSASSLTLRDSRWAAALLGYQMPRQRSSFFAFCYANGVPLIRVGKRKILFCESAVLDFLRRRSNAPLSAAAGQ